MAKLDFFSRRKGRILRENLTAYAFVAPATLIIGIFGLFPVFFTIYISAYRWRIKKTRFLGLDNFKESLGDPFYFIIVVLGFVSFGLAWFVWKGMAKNKELKWVRRSVAAVLILLGVGAIIYGIPYMVAGGDEDMFTSLRVTIWYSLGTVPLQLVFGLAVAYFLFQKVPGKQGLRVTYLLPYVVPSVASAAVFERIFTLRPEGLANQIIKIVGIAPQQWLREPKGIFELLAKVLNWHIPAGDGIISPYWLSWVKGPSLALVSIMLYNLWVFVGYYALIYLAGLGNISQEFYEAAEIDGASRWQSFIHITVPLLSPSTYFLTLLGVIGTFKAFNHIFVLRNPAVGDAVDTMSLYIFFTFFSGARFGYAASMALVLFVIILALTFLQRRLLGGRVFYG